MSLLNLAFLLVRIELSTIQNMRLRSSHNISPSRRETLDSQAPVTPYDPCPGLAVEDYVTMVNGGEGTIRYIGPTEFASGYWIGVELIDLTGKNDGSVAGTRYFSCSPGFGVFVRDSSIKTVGRPTSRSSIHLRNSSVSESSNAQSPVTDKTANLSRISSPNVTAHPIKLDSLPVDPSNFKNKENRGYSDAWEKTDNLQETAKSKEYDRCSPSTNNSPIIDERGRSRVLVRCILS